MVDLSAGAVEDWIARHEPAAAAVRSGEVEIDDLPRVLSALARLGAALERARHADPAALAALLTGPDLLPALRTVLAHLNVQRRLRLVVWLAQATQAGGDDARRVLAVVWTDAGGPAHPDPGRPDPGRVVRESLQHLHRFARVRAIFAPARVEHLQALCENLEGA